MTICPTDTRINRSAAAAVSLCRVGKLFDLLPVRSPAVKQTDHGFWAVRGVSLEIPPGISLGVIGRNGAGKTTVLNLIAQTLAPSEGSVTVRGRVVALFQLGLGFQDEMSGRENVFLNGMILGASRRELETKLARIVAFSELAEFIDQPLGSYSQGMRLRLAFSVAAHLDCDILIVDEVLAVGDILFQNKCFQRLMDLKRSGTTLIISSQNLDWIRRFCDSAILMEGGQVAFAGDADGAIEAYRSRLQAADSLVFDNRYQKGTLNTQTKKWCDSTDGWMKRFGTQEAVIERVSFNGKVCSAGGSAAVRAGSSLRIRVDFMAKIGLETPHFGVALFRQDGAYCYGVNTADDGLTFGIVPKGKGYFELDLRRLLLAPGSYRISVAIWDTYETVAYDYHEGCYVLTVLGKEPVAGGLTVLPCRVKSDWLSVLSGTTRPEKGISLNLCGGSGPAANEFLTGQTLRVKITGAAEGDRKLWLAIYRDDGVLCQGVLLRRQDREAVFCNCGLLPGRYFLYACEADDARRISFSQGSCSLSFLMVSPRADHGTVLLTHSWRVRLPAADA